MSPLENTHAFLHEYVYPYGHLITFLFTACDHTNNFLGIFIIFWSPHFSHSHYSFLTLINFSSQQLFVVMLLKKSTNLCVVMRFVIAMLIVKL